MSKPINLKNFPNFLNDFMPQPLMHLILLYIRNPDDLKMPRDQASYFVLLISAFMKSLLFNETFFNKLRKSHPEALNSILEHEDDHQKNLQLIEVFLEHCRDFKNDEDAKMITNNRNPKKPSTVTH